MSAAPIAIGEAAFLRALDEPADYARQNDRHFREQDDHFATVDRVVAPEVARGRGLAPGGKVVRDLVRGIAP